MALSAGSRLGSYEILAAIGAGGMGEVYRARDTRLKREVALKIRTCLTKDRRKRTVEATTATFVLDHAAQLVERVEVPVAALQPAAVPRPPLWRRATPMAAAVGISALLAGAGVWLLTRPAPPSVVRTTVTTTGSTALTLSGTDRDVAITPRVSSHLKPRKSGLRS